MTIHDLNHLLDTTYRGSWKSRLYAKPLLSMAARNADVIITPSEYTKAMLSEHLDAEPAQNLGHSRLCRLVFSEEGQEYRRAPTSRANSASPALTFCL